MKRTLISLLALGAWVVASAALGERPNVLLITSDDQGFCELGAYADFADPATMGAWKIDKIREIKEITSNQAPIEVSMAAAAKCMPHVDGLAKQGMRFTDFHAAPTCAPSRAALMGSRYPQGYGCYSNDDFVLPGYGKGLPVDLTLPVELFQSSGYLTGLSGKWHLGQEEGQLPNERGFDFFFGFDRAHVEKYDSKRLLKNGKPTPAKGWLADQITDEAIEFLGMADAQQKPFFLYVAYNEPHGPMPDPPKQYMEAINSGSKSVDGYFGMIYGMDAGIGRILETLDAMGELDNTMILYGSDNGKNRRTYVSNFNDSTPGSFFGVPVPGNGPLQGCKWTPWEGGVRVPFIVRMPGGTVGSTDVLVSMLDVMPTLLDFAQIDIPESMKLDGRSFLPVLKGDDLSERPMFWASDSQMPFIDKSRERSKALEEKYKQRPKHEIRSGNFPPAWYVRTEKWKLMGWDDEAPVLFDMEKDIGETNDLSSQYPETVRDLKKQFAAWLDRQQPPVVFPMEQFEKLKAVH